MRAARCLTDVFTWPTSRRVGVLKNAFLSELLFRHAVAGNSTVALNNCVWLIAPDTKRKSRRKHYGKQIDFYLSAKRRSSCRSGVSAIQEV